MKPLVFLRKSHKWLGLIIGLQFLMWTAGGVVMTFFDIEQVRGEHTKAKPAVVDLSQPIAIGAAEVMQRIDFTPQQLALKGWLGKPVWLAIADNQQALIDANTGIQLSPLDETLARAVAKADFSGEGQTVEARLLQEPLGEVRGKALPIWQVQFDDEDNTRIYVSPSSGEVLARRNDTWRLFDFFWMLHIMDYKERTDFNHPLLLTAAILALLMSLLGLYLVLKLVFLKPKR